VDYVAPQRLRSSRAAHKIVGADFDRISASPRYEVVAETGSTSVPETGKPLRHEVAHRCGHEHKTWEAAERCRRHLRNGGRSARWYNSTVHYAWTGFRAHKEDPSGDSVEQVIAARSDFLADYLASREA
jgi:hypothetical protein